MSQLKAVLVSFSLATACPPAILMAQTAYRAIPGSINFVQGQVNIDGRPINTNVTPSLQLQPGQTLATAAGNADILLAPGALLRIGDNSTVNLVAKDAGRTEVRIDQGIANVSVNVVRSGHLLLLDLQNGQTQILSRGLYAFNTESNTVRVFNGEADVFPGADTSSNMKPVALKEGHEITLATPDGHHVKPASFDRELADSDLLPWVGPRESQAALTDSTVSYSGSRYTTAGYGYGDGFYGDGPFYAGGYSYGYGYPWGPYGLWGFPFFGVGFGFYGGGYWGGGYGYPIHGPFPRGYAGSGLRGGYAGHAFAGGGGFSGGGSHGGAGRR